MMGLDTVELVMEIEETFHITIADRDAERLTTMGEVYHYVLDRVVIDPNAPCLSALAFYRVRRSLMERFGVARAAIRPSALLEEIIPRRNRPGAWDVLGGALGVRLPSLVCPEPWRSRLDEARTLALTLLLVAAPLAIVFLSKPPVWLAGGILSVVTAFGLWLGYAWTRPLAIELPEGCRDVAGLSRLVSFHLPRGEGWSRSGVWEALRGLVAAQLGVSPHELREETHFVYDLGLD